MNNDIKNIEDLLSKVQINVSFSKDEGMRIDVNNSFENNEVQNINEIMHVALSRAAKSLLKASSVYEVLAKKKYNLCKTPKDSYFIECTKNDIYMYHRTDLEKNIEFCYDTFAKCEKLSEMGFEENSDNNCTREKVDSYTIIFSFNTIYELNNFMCKRSEQK